MIPNILYVSHPDLHHIHHFEQKMVWHHVDSVLQRFGHLLIKQIAPLGDGSFGLLFVTLNVIEFVTDVH